MSDTLTATPASLSASGQAHEQVLALRVGGDRLVAPAVDRDDDRLPVVDQDLAVAVEDPPPFALVGRRSGTAGCRGPPRACARRGPAGSRGGRRGRRTARGRRCRSPPPACRGGSDRSCVRVTGALQRRITRSASSAHGDALRPPVGPSRAAPGSAAPRHGALLGGQGRERPAPAARAGQGEHAVDQPRRQRHTARRQRPGPGPGRAPAPRRPTARRPRRWPP